MSVAEREWRIGNWKKSMLSRDLRVKVSGLWVSNLGYQVIPYDLPRVVKSVQNERVI